MTAAVALAWMLGLSPACSEEVPVADPPGTITTDLIFDTPTGFAPIRFATGSTTTPPFDLTLDSSSNFNGDLATVGPVAGVGEILEVPTIGFVATMAAQAGDGYVVRSNDGLGNYFRVFAADPLIGATSGGVIGMTIKWAPLSVITSLTIAPADPVITRPAPGPAGCALETLQLAVESVSYTDGTTGTVPATGMLWTSDGPSSGLGGAVFVSGGGRVTVSGSTEITPNGCPATPLDVYTVTVQAGDNGATSTTSVTVQ